MLSVLGVAVAALHVPLALSGSRTRAPAPRLQAGGDDASPFDQVATAYKLFQEGNAAGGFKQGVADAIAGEFDRDSVTAE
eukprot:7206818-Prymnesium_polylepis.1